MVCLAPLLASRPVASLRAWDFDGRILADAPAVGVPGTTAVGVAIIHNRWSVFPSHHFQNLASEAGSCSALIGAGVSTGWIPERGSVDSGRSVWHTAGMAAWTLLEPVAGFTVHVAATARGVCRLSMNLSDEQFLRELANSKPKMEWWRDDGHPVLAEARRQLQAYFRGRLREFDLLPDVRGTPFQKRVWRALQEIPYGETRSYKEIALRIGAPNATRAVGGANRQNPIPIVVPCHRVIAADGRLGGYGGGLEVKRMLLSLEARNCERAPAGRLPD